MVLAKIERNGNSAERGEKKIGEKRKKVRKEEWKKQYVSFYTKENEIKTAYFSNMSMFLLIYMKTYFNANELVPYIVLYSNVCHYFQSHNISLFCIHNVTTTCKLI